MWRMVRGAEDVIISMEWFSKLDGMIEMRGVLRVGDVGLLVGVFFFFVFGPGCEMRLVGKAEM